jgi:hypothetical protein
MLGSGPEEDDPSYDEDGGKNFQPIHRFTRCIKNPGFAGVL